MHFKSLKANVALNLALLLFIAIGLTDFVLIRFIENRLLENYIDSIREKIVSEDIASLDENIVYTDFTDEPGDERRVDGIFDDLSDSDLTNIHSQVLKSQNSIVRFAGNTWGVFWKQSKYVIVAAPRSDYPNTGIIIARLAPIYDLLRGAHRMALYFLAVNFLFIFLIGAFRLSRMVTRPIQRLIRITDANQNTFDGFDLMGEKQSDEFGRLSSALHRMLQRIKNDNLKLQQSIAEIEKTNMELKQAQQEIIRAEKLASIGRLSAGLAHEIGNPLGIVLGYLGLLKNRSIAPEDVTAMDYIHRAETEINRINIIIRQLLDFSRPTEENAEVFAMHDLIKEAGNMLSQQPLTESIRIIYDLAAHDDLVFADYHQLHQVIVNLMINACDSIASNFETEIGEIHFASRVVGEDSMFFQFELHDNGCGIPEEHLDKIFDPFFTTKETGEGTGLGLSVCYMIIERFGGSIDVRSAVNSGTTIIIRLPRAGYQKSVCNHEHCKNQNALK